MEDCSKRDALTNLEIVDAIRELGEHLKRSLQDLRQDIKATGAPSAFNFSNQSKKDQLPAVQVDAGIKRLTRPALPDPRLVRQIILQRQLRNRFFDMGMFADPAWEMLLDLTAARSERKRVSVTSLCIASGVPPTTALRWISVMLSAGLFERVDDEQDRRRALISLTDKGADLMARYFDLLGQTAERVI
jgi:predicted transcriptional regulator